MGRVDDRIRQARRESGLSQEALAERIGVPPADLYRYEDGAQVSSRHLQLIAVATGKPIAFFLDGVGPGSQNGRGVGGRIRAVLAWLSEPVGVDTDADVLLAEVAARERELAERERRLAERERRLAGQEGRSRALEAEEGTDKGEEKLAEREQELETRAELLAREVRMHEARAAELDRIRKELDQRERELDAAATAPVREARAERAAAVAAAGFNLDALEHELDVRAADFPERAEEWRAYIVFLREFVHADGDLPPTFNALIREVFRELL
jgi:transcriptional regulator with XRE-family HTH domain